MAKKKCPSGTKKSSTGKTCRKNPIKKKSVKKSKKGLGRSYGY